MTESAREEALRLAREAGFDLHWPREPEVGVFKNGWVAEDEQIERLIALARQRPRWVWVPEEPTREMLLKMEAAGPNPDNDDGMDPFRWERGSYKAALAAAPKPGEGT
jgi:hypothetical protein